MVETEKLCAKAKLLILQLSCRCAIAPLIIGPVTEVVGRRYIYVFSHLGFTLTFLMLAIKVSLAISLQYLWTLKFGLEQHCASDHRAWDTGSVRLCWDHSGE